MKKVLYILFSILLFAALIAFPDCASAAAKNGLKMCGELIIPSLFPFFIATNLLTQLASSQRLGRLFSPLCRKLFGTSGNGASAFIIGVSAGYPMGASYVAALRKQNAISAREAESLLIFCNNSGPSFIIGACGVGVFHSSEVGLFLYAVHILAAALGGIVLSKSSSVENCEDIKPVQPVSFSQAFTSSVKSAVSSCASICGYVVAFGVLLKLLEKAGIIYALASLLSRTFGIQMQGLRALIGGFFELGNGIGAMQGLLPTEFNLALAAFILGWGGVSVLFQTYSVIDGAKIKTARYIIGRFFIALLGASLALLGSVLIF